MTITCALIDDEPLALDLLESYVRKTPFLALKGCYSSAVTAMMELSKTPVNLLFLDIQMPELDGLQFAKMIAKDTRVIFTTAFNQYALDGYRVNALDYLLKPISYPEFLESANRALHWFELLEKQEESDDGTETPEAIFIKSDYKLVRIILDDIMYVEGLKDYIKIYVESRPKPILSLMSMKMLEEHLPNNRFLRVHRSYIVNMGKIELIERNNIVFGNKSIPISENYKNNIQEYLDKQLLLGRKNGSGKKDKENPL